MTQALQAIDSGKDTKFVVVAHGYPVFGPSGAVKFSPLAHAVCDKVEELYKSGEVERIILLGGHDIPATLDETIADRMKRQLWHTRDVSPAFITTQNDFHEWKRYIAPRDLVEEVMLFVQLLDDLRIPKKTPIVSVIGDLWVPRAKHLYSEYGFSPTFAAVKGTYVWRQWWEEYMLRVLMWRNPLGTKSWGGRYLVGVRRARTPRPIQIDMHALLHPKLWEI